MTIFFNQRYIYNDEYTEETIQHEIAHCLQPPQTETHGVEFERAFAEVRAEVRRLEITEMRELYPCPEGPSSTFYLRHPELTAERTSRKPVD